jgi:hypothetical protein
VFIAFLTGKGQSAVNISRKAAKKAKMLSRVHFYFAPSFLYSLGLSVKESKSLTK